MKLVDSVKRKLDNGLGNETIGDYGFDKEKIQEKPQQKKDPIKKTPKQEKKIKQKPIKNNKSKKTEIKEEILETTEDSFEFIPIIEDVKVPTMEFFSREVNLENKSYPVLDLLGIARNVDMTGLVTSEDIENTEFTLTAPTGIDPTEIERFCNLLEHDISRYRAIIETRQQDFETLLKEVIKLEQELVDRQQENELANFIIDQKSSEEKLKEELVVLQLENQELKHKLLSLEEKQKQSSNDKKKELPSRPQRKLLPKKINDETDSFDDLLKELSE